MEWQVYLREWPSGEEAMDLRFEALRMDNLTHREALQYTVAGKRMPPRSYKVEDFKIFNRLGNKRTAKYFDEMTPEEVSKRMHRFKASMQGQKGAKK